MSSFSNDPFVQRLQHCPGNPWTLFEAQQQLDALVLQPLSSDASDADLFVEFLANTFHRRLLQCFIGTQNVRVWSLESLMKQARPPSPQALSQALEHCRLWQIAHEDGTTQTWQGHPRLTALNNLGWTFEWIIQAILERDYGAFVRRHVILGEIAHLGEIDVLALLGDGRSLLIECKSSSKGLTDIQLDRFLRKAHGFPADYALLLIDTDNPQQMQQRMGQLGQAMDRVEKNTSVGAIQRHGGSHVVCLHEGWYVADTGGGISTTLQAILTQPPRQP